MATRNRSLAKSLTFLTDDGIPNFASGSDITLTPDSDTGVISAGVTVAGQSASTVTNFTSIDSLPLSNLTAGTLSYVQSTGTFYYSTGAGWYKITTTNSAPIIVNGANASYTLATDGTSTIVSLTAVDADSTPLTWSYSITGGSLGSTATIAQDSSVFTITPSTDSADIGSFNVTFSVTDGTSIATDTASFTLAFSTLIDLSSITLYASTNVDRDSPITSTATSFKFNADGSQLIVCRENNSGGGAEGAIFSFYDLSSAYDLQTISYNSDFLIDPGRMSPYDFFIGNNGYNLYIADFYNNIIRQYPLATAYDVSSVTGSMSGTLTYSGASTNVQGIYFSSDGVYLFVVKNGINNNVFRHVLSTPWNISTASAADQVIGTINDGANEQQHRGLFFNPSGEQLFVFGDTGNIFKWSLTNPWDLSVRTYDGSRSSPFTYATSIVVTPDRANLFALNRIFNEGDFRQYSIP